MIRKLLIAAALFSVATLSQAQSLSEQAEIAIQSVVNVRTKDAITYSRLGEVPGVQSGWPTKATEYLNRWLTNWRLIPAELAPAYDSTGFIVEVESRTYVMTAAHSVEEMRRDIVTITTLDGQEHAARLVGHEPRRDGLDIALLSVPTLESPALQFAQGVERGELVAVLKSPTRPRNNIGAGVVTETNQALEATPKSWGGRELIKIDATVFKGDSGGPVINEAGQVIGVISMLHSSNEMGFLVNADQALAAAHRIASNCDVSDPCDLLAVIE
ncbi:S1 family peptidase [Halomonas hibernica]|uniref:S1 family peptidase n=1 Tax=Halomonas hibernica TaxID=2591147 RepID=UPI001554ECD9|nr:serine protease [Halomonas hibernica]